MQEYDFIEHFAGAGVLTKEVRGHGHHAAALDKMYGRGMDILQPSGFGSLN